MRHMTKYLVDISSRNDIRSISGQPDIILSVGEGTSIMQQYLATNIRISTAGQSQ